MVSLQAFLSFLPRAPKSPLPLPLPLLTPATQAREDLLLIQLTLPQLDDYVGHVVLILTSFVKA